MSIEFTELDAAGQAQRVKSGQKSSLEPVDAVIQRLDSLDGQINSVICKIYHQAREAAPTLKVTDARFAGVPTLLIDLFTEQKPALCG